MTKKNELPTEITYRCPNCSKPMSKWLITHQCPDCSRPMSKWSDGKTSKGKKEPRIKCSQCNRWQWKEDGKKEPRIKCSKCDKWQWESDGKVMEL